MTTPNGGAYETVVATLYGVAIDDPALADFLEITEHMADGTVIARTYVGDIVDGPVDKSNLMSVEQGQDNDPIYSDSMKRTWDIYDADYVLVTTLEGLLKALGLKQDYKGWETVANMTGLPVWDTAPPELKTEVDAWLSGKF